MQTISVISTKWWETAWPLFAQPSRALVMPPDRNLRWR